MKYNSRKIEYFDFKRMNEILKLLEESTIFVYIKTESEIQGDFLHTTYILDTEKYFKVFGKIDRNFAREFVFNKANNEEQIKVNPGNAYRNLTLYGKIKNIVKEKPEMFETITNDDGTVKIQNSARPLLGFNPTYNYKEVYAYCYDLNSAYATMLGQEKMIDTFNMKYDKLGIEVGKNEVGFVLDRNLSMRKEGQYADVVFPLIDNPYKKFVDKYYGMKKNAKTKEDRLKAKAVLNYCIGVSQNHNPFFRAYIIHSCNNFIKNILNKYSDKIVSWNTDSIYSTIRIPEIESNIGDELGQWKLEYKGLLRTKNNSYQKVGINKVTYRGVINEAFGKDFNILTDEIPKFNSCIKYDYNKKRLYEVNRNE